MKKSIFIVGAFAALSFVSCKKETTTVTDASGDTAVVVTQDSTALDSTGAEIREGAQDAVNATGEALNDAGQAIEAGANEVGQDIENATDGDGNPNR